MVAWTGSGVEKTTSGVHSIYYQIINSDDSLSGGNVIVPGTESVS